MAPKQLVDFTEPEHSSFNGTAHPFLNGTARIIHQCRKTAVLSCHRFLINSGVEKMKKFKYGLELWPPDVSK